MQGTHEEELDAWEHKVGFVSLRSIQNKIYDELKYAKKKDDIYEFLKKYIGIFELVLNDNDEQEIKPVVDGLIFPILTNSKGFYRVGNNISKVTQDYIVTTDIKNYDKLQKLSDAQIPQLDDKEFEITKHTIYNKTGCGRDKSASTTDGNRRVKIWFIVENSGSGTNYSINSGIKVRGYKRVLGIWYWYTTNLTLYGSEYTVSYPDNYSNGSWEYKDKYTYVQKRSQETSVMRVTEHLNSFYFNGSNYPDYFFNNLYGRASSRGVNGNIVTLTCGQ